MVYELIIESVVNSEVYFLDTFTIEVTELDLEALSDILEETVSPPYL